MARFIPDSRVEDTAYDSEQIVYESLRTVRAGYVVLHSLPWLRPSRDLVTEPLREGEADFVVDHPDRGILVLEVKGAVPQLRQRTWFRSNKERRGSFDQARRNRYSVLGAIEERSRGRVHRDMFTHGDVVVFPHCPYEGPALPLNAEPRSCSIRERSLRSACGSTCSLGGVVSARMTCPTPECIWSRNDPPLSNCEGVDQTLSVSSESVQRSHRRQTSGHEKSALVRRIHRHARSRNVCCVLGQSSKT